jgi:tetratricopeptide (TPR) repeat protein
MVWPSLMSKHSNVRIWAEDVVIPTYLPAAPDPNPMFLERRVYQGSSGKVYPLPFTDRIAENKIDRCWKAIWLENKYLRVMVLPEIGGRIHIAQDKTNNYDFVYRQNVIKPALVGLAGSWISGGVEFNWPQHHRPGTFLPVDAKMEAHADGSKTVWLSEHDSFSRMKGMHGICLHPDRAFIEIKVRVYNRTPLTQTFLWWANIATHVHEAYQSFFPPDVHYVADHAKRAISKYPLCDGHYYGVNYKERARKGVPTDEQPKDFVPPHCGGEVPVDYRPNDLSWYANISTPCSYMCIGSEGDFFGGYDHKRQAGIVHIANHHISPGKKQWTWGNHDFGYAWDRNLTDGDGPYIELMAGVYTDNQPDFSFLRPGETKSWSQFLYPIQKTGPADHANLDAAVVLKRESKCIHVGVSVTGEIPQAQIRLEQGGKILREWTADLMPGQPFAVDCEPPRKNWKWMGISLRVLNQNGRELIAYQPKAPAQSAAPSPATEPLSPEMLDSNEDLYLTGLHLEQYRHATRCPTLYWQEALRRDPYDSRCNNALGLWHLRRGEFDVAKKHFRAAIKRLTGRNPNPSDGEAFYNLGLCLRHEIDSQPSEEPAESILFDEAYAAFYKATWNQAWQAAGYQALAEMDCRRRDWKRALEHLNCSLRYNTENLKARDLKAIVLFKLKQEIESRNLLLETIELDPLDWWARYLLDATDLPTLQNSFDLAIDFARAGFHVEAAELLHRCEKQLAQKSKEIHTAEQQGLLTQDWGAKPLLYYYLGWLYERGGEEGTGLSLYRQAAKQSPDHCFPSRLEEIAILNSAMRANSSDAMAPYYLGNLFYNCRRYTDATKLWERSAKLRSGYSITWRNLGIAYFNVAKRPANARKAYDRALSARPNDARLIYERDQLWKRLGESPASRLKELEKRADLARQRDDLAIELCALYNQTGQYEKALEIIANRRFQPWEGGEGQVLAQHVRTRLGLGREALRRNDLQQARSSFEEALLSPLNLSEAKHLLANQSDIHYWLGVACDALGDHSAARKHWRAAAVFQGDFQGMRVQAFSEMSYFSALAWGRLGRQQKKEKLLRELLAFAQNLQKAEAKIDYFATSLPTMLLFEDDIQLRQETTALLLQAQARLGLGQTIKAKALFKDVLKRDPNNALAIELLNSPPEN